MKIIVITLILIPGIVTDLFTKVIDFSINYASVARVHSK